MEYYNNQNGLKYELQKRCKGDAPFGENRKEFPDTSDDRLERFHFVEEKMNKEHHPLVNLGAAVAGDGLLTDHGVNHVQSVIQHANDIISDVKQLTGYEIYLLLLSIHFHDVGNIYGRYEHEQKIEGIINDLGKELPLDIPEKQFINDIATAHGGYCDGDKDTIRHIGSDQKYGNVDVRPKMLAAILRFADEISDDLGRAKFDFRIPKANEVFHEYSKALLPVSIEGSTILLHYQIPYELTQRKVGKGSKETYLYDEILSRIAKCMRELEYCRKYACGLIKVSSLSVKIEIIQNGTFRPMKKVGDSFRLTLQGYPEEREYLLESYMEKIDDMSGTIKELKYKDGNDLKREVISKGAVS